MEGASWRQGYFVVRIPAQRAKIDDAFFTDKNQIVTLQFFAGNECE